MAWDDFLKAEAWRNSMANLLKRGEEVGDYIQNAPTKAGQAILDAGKRQEALMNEAFDPTGKTLIRNPQAANQAAMNLLEGPLGFAPAGITVFHGTSLENANKIKDIGFKPNEGIGISSEPNKEFVFVTPSKSAAEHYGKSNIRNKESTVLKADLEGKILDLNKSLHEHEAFGEASKLLGLPIDEKGYYSLPEIKKALQEQGYSGIAYKDRSANNRKAFAVMPESVTPQKTRQQQLLKAFDEQALTPIYHGTSPESAKTINKSGFDVTKSADGTIWFTSNPNIGEVAATGKGAVIKKMLDEKGMKLGGWDEIDKYSVNELIQKGYDGVKLKDSDGITYQIFNPEKLKD